MHANEAESAIKLSVRPNQASMPARTGCERLTPQGTAARASSGAASSETPQCTVVGECAVMGETVCQGGCCVPGTSPADQTQAASRQCLPRQQQVRIVDPKTAARNPTHAAHPQEQKVLKNSRENFGKMSPPRCKFPIFSPEEMRQNHAARGQAATSSR